MKFLHRNLLNDRQWQIYQELELIPHSIPQPQSPKLTFAFGLDWAWRLLIVTRTRELIYEQEAVDYLQRCWALKELETGEMTSSNPLQKFWMLMN